MTVLTPRALPPTTRFSTAIAGTVCGGVTAILGVLATGSIAQGAFLAVLAACSAVDIKERRIPNRITYPATATILLAATLGGAGMASLAGLAGGGGFMLLAALASRDQLGLGDVKLSAFVGATIGIEAVPVFLIAGTLIGACAAGMLLLRQRDLHATLPYGPFLSAGAAWAVLAHGTVIG